MLLRPLTRASVASKHHSSSIAGRLFLRTFASPASNRRARRSRRSDANVKLSTWDPSLLANIEQQSRNNLTQRVEMPMELLQRLTSIVRKRTNAQLSSLRQKHMDDRSSSRQDMSKTPIGWTLDRTQQIPPFVYGPTETLAFLAFEMEASYATTHAALTELRNRVSDFAPSSVLDFGAGPGTASWVAKAFYDDSLDKYRVVEPSQSMIDALQVLLDGFPGLSIRRSLADMSRDINAGNKYDLIVMSYVLSDITNDFERVATISAIWELLSENGCMVLVDRGSPWGSHQVRSARQFVLDLVDKDEAGVRIIAPCPHQFECPMAGKTWCHFVQRSPAVFRPRVATTKRWHGQKGSKFSYVIMQKTEKTNAEAEKKPFARMLRKPLLANRHVHLDLCTPDGKLERRSVTKGKAVREVYRASRKAHWGALWPADESTYRKDK